MSAIRDNAARARQAIISLLLVVTTILTLAAFRIWQYFLLEDSINGIYSDDQLSLTDQLVTTTYWSTIGAYVLCAILFIMWFRRAYYNLHQLNPGYPSETEGWAAGAWFVPILNLFRPYNIMKEIWAGTLALAPNRVSQQYPGGIISTWWILWIVLSVVERGVSGMYKTAEDAPSFQTAIIIQVINILLTTVCAALLIYLIRSYSKLEKEVKELLATPDNSIFAMEMPEQYQTSDDHNPPA